MTNYILLLCFLVTAGHSMQEESNSYFLDLTKERLSTAVCGGWGRGGINVMEGRGILTEPDPFAIRLIHKQDIKKENKRGELFEIHLKNISSNIQVFPMETDDCKIKQNFRQPPPGYQAAFISLFAEGNTLLKFQPLGQFSLYGADVVAGSILHLQPGETVRIRLWGKPELGNPWKKEKSEGVLKYGVYAEYKLAFKEIGQKSLLFPIRSPSIPVEFEN